MGDPTAAGPHDHVPFRVRRFRDARLLWLNRSWLRANGHDMDDPEAVRQLSERLVADYGVGAPSPHEPASVYDGPWRRLLADRYGGTGGARTGGSGRCGDLGSFGAKGVGRTPLASDQVDWYHAHGCLWLEEAVREAICAEIARAEFPCSAIPVVAIIDTGSRIYWDDGSTGERRAVLIRPTFTRLAHFERSVFFGTSGFEGSDQWCDEARVAQRVRSLGPEAHARLITAFQAIGEQVGFSRCSRLWPGPVLTSNITLDGQLLDFGAFRSLASWRRVFGATTDAPFGDEDGSVERAAASLRFHLARHGAQPPSSAALREAYRQGLGEGMRRGADLAFAGLEPGVREALAHAVSEEFRRQQRGEVAPATVGFAAEAEDPAAMRRWAEAWTDRLAHVADAGAVRRSLARFARPRLALHREWLVARAARLGAGPEVSPASVEAFIRRQVSAGRRLWPGLPPELAPIRHRPTDKGFEVLAREPRTLRDHSFAVAG